MDSFTLFVTLRAARPVDDAAVDAAVDAMARTVRADEGEFRVWRVAENAHLLRVSVDCVAADLESALERGHELAAETCAPGAGLAVDEVVAMTDDDQLVWRARP